MFRSITSFPACAQQCEMGRQAFPVALALNGYLIAGVGQPIKGTVAQDGVVEEAQPFVHGPVAGDHEAGSPVPVEDQVVEVGGLLGGEPVQAQVVDDEQVRRQEGTEAALQGVVDPGLIHDPEVIVGVAEAHGVAGTDRGIAQGLGQEALADPGGSDEQDVLAPSQEFQGEGGVQQSAVQSNRRRPVEVLQAADLLEASLLQAHLDAPVSAAVHLVCEDNLQEGGVVQLLPAGQGMRSGRVAAMGPSCSRLSSGVRSVVMVMSISSCRTAVSAGLGEDAAGPGEASLGQRRWQFRGGLLLQGLHQDALHAAHVDEVDVQGPAHSKFLGLFLPFLHVTTAIVLSVLPPLFLE